MPPVIDRAVRTKDAALAGALVYQLGVVGEGAMVDRLSSLVPTRVAASNALRTVPSTTSIVGRLREEMTFKTDLPTDWPVPMDVRRSPQPKRSRTD